MSITLKTQKYVWGLFAGRCAICRESLIHNEEEGDHSLVGEIAHIVGRKRTAARGKHIMSNTERDHPDNLLLLCRKHHKLIDDSEKRYDVDYLRSTREAYLSWLKDQLAHAEPWHIDVSAFSYLNVPRLGEFAAMNGYSVRLPNIAEGSALRELGFDLNKVTAAFRQTLENIEIRSIEVSRIKFAHDDYIGQIIRFDRLKFRTKNIHAQSGKNIQTMFSGDLRKDPHIYRKFDFWTLILNIDPRWITTSTAHVMFRPTSGSTVFTGFARIVHVDVENLRMTSTAMAIGQPRTAFDIFDRQIESPGKLTLDISDLEDQITRSRGDCWLGRLECCDFCGKNFEGENYMIDGPTKRGGPWGCMCEQCYQKTQQPLGVGKGQLYRHTNGKWLLVGGYPYTKGKDVKD